MLKYILLLFALLCMNSCTVGPSVTTAELSSHSYKIKIHTDRNNLHGWEINFSGTKTEASTAVSVIKKALKVLPSEVLNKMPESASFNADKDYYRLFFTVCYYATVEYQNDLLRFGLIEYLWQKAFLHRSALSLFVKSDTDTLSERPYRIGDLDNLFAKHSIRRSDIELAYPYTVHYLLKKVLFVSLQEFNSRPARYFNLAELDTYFSRMVALPESMEFVRYLTQRFSLKKVLKLMETPFNGDIWEKELSEKINETEAAFAKTLENKSFTGVYASGPFKDALDQYLELYNKTTKPTLFHK